MDSRKTAITMFRAAVASVQPQQLLPAYLYSDENGLQILGEYIPWNPEQKIWIVGAGKASAAMARVAEQILGDHLQGGLVITKYAHSLPLKKIECREAGHPVPDLKGVAATRELITLLQQTAPDDLIICLLSGGASALLADLPDGASLADLQQVFSALLASGADISEVNTVRKHLSAMKGGQLPGYAPKAWWFTLMISDVPGDDSAIIGSGPTVPDNRSFGDACEILQRYQLWNSLPVSIRNHLELGYTGQIPDTPKSDDPIFLRVKNQIIGSNKLAVEAAKKYAVSAGLHLMEYPEGFTGNTSAVADSVLTAIRNYQGLLPVCLVTGGESTVVVTGEGKGGRNQHLALTIKVDLERVPLSPGLSITILCAGTDGTDGPTDAAGAIVDLELMKQAGSLDLSAQTFWENQDAYHFFEAAGGLLKTGATQTNVMDLVIVILDAKS